MNSIAPDKTVTLRIPNLDENLVRTGVVGDGSCFFHAFNLATRRHYRSFNDDEKKHQVQSLRTGLSEFVTAEVWASLGDIVTVEYETMLSNTLTSMFVAPFRSLPFTGFEKLVAILQEIVDANKILDIFLPYKKETVLQRLVAYISSLLDNDASNQRFIEMCLDFFIKVCEFTSVEALRKFKNDIANPLVFADDKMIVVMKLYTNYDFIFIDASTKKMYQQGVTLSGTKPIVIFLWVDGCHYESVGRLLSGNKIQRIFRYGDDIVGKLSNLV